MQSTQDVGVDPASIGVAWSAFDPTPMPIEEKGFDKLNEKLYTFLSQQTLYLEV